MNIKQLIQRELAKNEMDGLGNTDLGCACVYDDLAPCGHVQLDCVMGKKVPCPTECGDHDWHIEEREFCPECRQHTTVRIVSG